jgi:hypothetical protein
MMASAASPVVARRAEFSPFLAYRCALRPGERRSAMAHAFRILAAALLLGAWSTSRADPAVAQFAGVQLGMAEAALEQARRALQANDYTAARRLAAQAALDARLAWSMSRSEALRRAAVEVNRRAERLRWRGLAAAGAASP